MEEIQARRAFDFGPREQETPALDLHAARDQGQERFQHLTQQLEQFLRLGIRVGDGRLHPRRQRRQMHLGMLDDVADDGPVEAFLAAEIILDGRQVHAGALGELTRAGALVSLGREDLERRLEDAAARILAFCLGRRASARDGLGHELALRTMRRPFISIDRLCQSTDIFAFSAHISPEAVRRALWCVAISGSKATQYCASTGSGDRKFDTCAPW